jgi:hypothetical protein
MRQSRRFDLTTLGDQQRNDNFYFYTIEQHVLDNNAGKQQSLAATDI